MNQDEAEVLGLRTLEDISSIILHSHDLQETLDNIVALIARRMGTDVCSIYLLNDDGEILVLRATKGLSTASVGKVSMKTSEGLTGLVVEQRGVVNIENAPLHPRYKYFREAKEERFHSFLGLPLFERKTPVGVLVVQTREPRSFTEAEISAASTIAYQIASIVINAKLLDSVHRKEMERAYFEQELERLRSSGVIENKAGRGKKKKQKQTVMFGIPASPGFCSGKLSFITPAAGGDGGGLETALPPAEERKRFTVALEKAKIQTVYIEKRVAEVLSKEDAAIFHTHLMILEDRTFLHRITDLIDENYSAAQAVRKTVEQYVAAFNQMDDPYLRERSADMEDIGRRIIGCLYGNGLKHRGLRTKRIIVTDEILPSDLATLDHDKILGIIAEKGDVNSHAAIMARSLGIPAVLGIAGLLQEVSPRDEVTIDGTSGSVYVNPNSRIRTEYERLQHDYSKKQQAREWLRDLPAETLDGVRVALRANIGLLSDVRVALANGAEGAGLYRTEFPYLARETFPDRHEQCALYRKIFEGFGVQPVTIRTLDIGGDKRLPYFVYPKEDNPFMGWRSIRVSLEREDIFREQLGGVLMASPFGRISLMFPLVSSLEEVQAIRKILAEVRRELDGAGILYDKAMRLGIMIELPAAVQIAEILIREVDFFSIGTNDLIQYTLAADRNNPKVKKYYNPYHPAVLHSIKRVADVAHSSGKPVSLCGEMAANPANAVLLLGLGIADFSLSAPYIPVVKEAIRATSLAQAKELAAEVLAMDSATAIGERLATVAAEWRARTQ